MDWKNGRALHHNNDSSHLPRRSSNGTKGAQAIGQHGGAATRIWGALGQLPLHQLSSFGQSSGHEQTRNILSISFLFSSNIAFLSASYEFSICISSSPPPPPHFLLLPISLSGSQFSSNARSLLSLIQTPALYLSSARRWRARNFKNKLDPEQKNSKNRTGLVQHFGDEMEI